MSGVPGNHVALYPVGENMRLVLILSLLAATGCVHRPPAGPLDAPPTRMEVDPTRIQLTVDPLTGLSVWDAETLFQLGWQSFEDDEWVRARALYRKLLAEFPTSPHIAAARWNEAMCSERLGDLEAAAAGFFDYAATLEASDRGEAATGWVRGSLLLQRLDRHLLTETAIRKTLAIPDLDVSLRWEARMLAAMNHTARGWFDLAETELDRVRREIRKATLDEDQPHPYESAMVWYHAGDLYRRRAAAVPIAQTDRPSDLREALDEKARLLLEARGHLRRSLRHGVPFWTGAAGVALGGVYEDFRRDLLDAPLPQDLKADPEAAGVYMELLGERTRAFLERAARDYREVLQARERFGLPSDWVKELESALARCEAELGVAHRAQAPGEETVTQ